MKVVSELKEAKDKLKSLKRANNFLDAIEKKIKYYTTTLEKPPSGKKVKMKKNVPTEDEDKLKERVERRRERRQKKVLKLLER